MKVTIYAADGKRTTIADVDRINFANQQTFGPFEKFVYDRDENVVPGDAEPGDTIVVVNTNLALLTEIQT